MEHSEENVDFWLHCEMFKDVKEIKRKQLADKIYQAFIQSNAPCEVSRQANMAPFNVLAY